MRNALAHIPRYQHQMLAAVIRTAFVQEAQAEADVLAFMTFTKEHWPQIASDGSVIRLVGALMAEHTDEWQVSTRYMGQESLQKVGRHGSTLPAPKGKTKVV